jgi:hypothetical protein
MEHQTIVVTQKNDGCLSGCGTALGILLLIGIGVEYWYVALPLAVVGVVAAVWYHSNRQEHVPAATPVPAPPAPAGPALGALTTGPCPRCGQHSTGNFCEHCGSARGRTCSGCERQGLETPFCPHCGAATFVPPT